MYDSNRYIKLDGEEPQIFTDDSTYECIFDLQLSSKACKPQNLRAFATQFSNACRRFTHSPLKA